MFNRIRQAVSELINPTSVDAAIRPFAKTKARLDAVEANNESLKLDHLEAARINAETAQAASDEAMRAKVIRDRLRDIVS